MTSNLKTPILTEEEKASIRAKYDAKTLESVAFAYGHQFMAGMENDSNGLTGAEKLALDVESLAEHEKQELLQAMGYVKPYREKVHRLTPTVKETFTKVFELMQTEDDGVSLYAFAQANPKEFYKLCAKLIPLEVQQKGNVSLQVVTGVPARVIDGEVSVGGTGSPKTSDEAIGYIQNQGATGAPENFFSTRNTVKHNNVTRSTEECNFTEIENDVKHTNATRSTEEDTVKHTNATRSTEEDDVKSTAPLYTDPTDQTVIDTPKRHTWVDELLVEAPGAPDGEDHSDLV